MAGTGRSLAYADNRIFSANVIPGERRRTHEPHRAVEVEARSEALGQQRLWGWTCLTGSSGTSI
jgi:hypothetical protein